MFLRIYRGTVPSEYSEERVPRNIPRKMSLGIIRGNSSVGIFLSIDVYMSKTHRSMNVRGNIPTKFSLGIFRGHFRQNNGPRNFLGNFFPRNSVGKFRGISDERRNSEELFPTTCFVVMSSDYVRGRRLRDVWASDATVLCGRGLIDVWARDTACDGRVVQRRLYHRCYWGILVVYVRAKLP
ncbi:hypothetical protein F2Q69_00004715 [Brassica cretica]|uniref:Uncharacterized protein n=1 Tax=Brassica cretica TaxID=69181 RepID=A0A8S9NV91_BRACR|nr:hypothetical protein F2Q69_00004715 [Brassica cretica]